MQLQYLAGVSRTTVKAILVLTALLFSVRALTQVEPTWQTNLDQQLTSWESVKSPAISVAVVKNGQVLYSKSNGMANINQGILNDSTIQFWIASVTKQFTAAAIYKLLQHTNLSLSTSIRFLLPELPPLFEPVTIDHLLHHTSGIRDGFVLTALSKKPQSGYTNENVLHYLKASKRLNFSPGTRFEYNNAGYVLLAMAVEKVAGTSFPIYLKDSIFHPLGMHNSYVASSFPLNTKQAEGYREGSGNVYDAYHFEGQTYGSTGVITTLSDLVRWSQFIQRPELVPSHAFLATRLLETGTLHNKKSIAYAGGLEKFTYKGRTLYEHFGADEGFKADILYFPETKISIIGLTNNSSYYGLLQLLCGVSDLVHGEKEASQPAIEVGGDVRETSFYYNTKVPMLVKAQYFSHFIKIGNSIDGFAAPYKITGDTIRSQDPIPTTFLQRNESLELLNNYYQVHTKLHKIEPVVKRDDLASMVGQYYSDELQTGYQILQTENGLQFEFVPGTTFNLFRLTRNDFLFEYLGPNYVQFGQDGFTFSREGCRKLFFKKQ